MIDSIIHFSVRQKLLVGLFVIGLIGWGAYSIQHLPIDAVPDITDNQVQIITTSPSLAAQEVEQLITFPLEIALGNIPNVIETRSISRFGLSVITVVFEENMDVYLSRQLISERIKMAEADIPEGLGKPEMGPITTGLGEIYQYVIHPAEGYEDQYTSTDLRTMQDWIIKRQLTNVEGVIEINSSGGFLKQYEVAVDPKQLNSKNIKLTDVFDALARNNANTGGSYIEKTYNTYFIRGEGLLENTEAIENVVVCVRDGVPLLIKDVAKIQTGHAPRFGAVTMNGMGEVVAGQVMMLKGENSAEVTRRVKKRLEEIKKTLPEGVVLEPYLDRTKLVNRTTKTVATNLLEGGLIVVFVLVLLLGNLRAGLIVASVIPLSMLFAISMMHMFGISANLMSLGAIDFGLIIDGAVIIVEAIVHRLEYDHVGKTIDQSTLEESVLGAATRIRKSAAFGEIIILIVYLPILFLTGIEGKMFRPMAQTVSFAILGAFILSFTYVPMASALFLPKKWVKKRTVADRIMAFLHSLYEPVLKFAFRVRVLVIGIAIALFALSLWTFSRMGGEFIPTLEEGDFALHQILPPGSSIAQGVEVSAHLQRMLLDNFPEVEKVVTKIGTAEIPTDIMPLEAGDIYVILKPKKEWTSAGSREEMFEKMEEVMNQYPGVMYEFTQPIQMRFNELMTGVRQDIAIKIYGDNLGTLQQKAEQAEAIINTIAGVGDIQVEPVAGLQQLIIDYDRVKLAKHGLDIAALNQTISTGFAGESAGYIYEGEKRFDLVVRLDEPFRQDIEQIRNLYIPLPNGDQIPLQEVAMVSYQEGPAQISRDDTKRRITIGVNARNRDVESVVSDIQNRLGAELDLPVGYSVSYGGQFENLQRAQARLLVAVPAALILIFVLLYLTFNSVKQTLLIYTAIPLSAIGGIWALYLRDMPFSISAGVGFIALFGVAVLNGIVLIGQFNQLKKEGVSNTLLRIYQGAHIRLRPVIMTAAVASLGFLPMALSTTAGAEVQRPLATVVIGGLITATLLTLILLPILYYYLEEGVRFRPPDKTVLLLLPLFWILSPNIGSAQSLQINLDEAIQMAVTQHPNLQTLRLESERQNMLIEGAAIQPQTNLYFSGEEIDFSPNQGIQSFGVFQNFNLPKAQKSRKAAQRAQAELSVNAVALSEVEIRRQLRRYYYELVQLREKERLWQTLRQDYARFERLAQSRKDLGESGALPLLAAQAKSQEAQWTLNQLRNDYQLNLVRFNQWLASDSLFHPQDSILPLPVALRPSPAPAASPQIQRQTLGVELAQAQLQVAQNQLLPQLNTGFQLQSVAGDFLFWGYQVGVNVPLFRKGQKARVEAAEKAIDVSAQALNASRYQWERELRALQQSMQYQQGQLQNLENELLPLARRQMEAANEAYGLGEVNYLPYLQALENVYQLEWRRIEQLKNYHLSRTEWLFLAGE